MARFLSSRTLAGASPITAAGFPSLAPAARLLGFHRLSGGPRKAELFELEMVADAEASASDIEVLGMRRLEDAIHAILVRRSAPDWLPFVPGASYWVPPRRRRPLDGITELVSQLTNPLTEEEMMAFATVRGWPSSAYFVEGLSPQPLKKIQDRTSVQSDDEESQQSIEAYLFKV